MNSCFLELVLEVLNGSKILHLVQERGFLVVINILGEKFPDDVPIDKENLPDIAIETVDSANNEDQGELENTTDVNLYARSGK